ncbi:MAG TPA: phosphatase PAP2-related protein [Thermoanaerobaculia bacterium]|nr:phosphatase PAP2-related protein [Thermoanaerobaculia bacterium]
MSAPPWVVRAILVVFGLAGWFFTQARLARRSPPEGRIGDRILEWTEPLNRFFWEHPATANALLVATSALVDLLGIFLVVLGIFGGSFRPLLGLGILFALRQACQSLCALPAPERMIWRDPGFPSLLVTYGTSTDLFFSGHTAIAVYGCLELARVGGTAGAIAGAAIAVLEAATVLVLRAHYTMDVFAGAVTALWVYGAAAALAPPVDAWLMHLVRAA